jgi:hypothetical protein
MPTSLFLFLSGDPEKEIVKFSKTHQAGLVVKDFSPLRIARKWADGATQAFDQGS